MNMKEPSPYHPYSAADFERYYRGTMSPGERHALEKAALEDPFLADALEGYAFTATPADDLAAIRQALQGKEQKRRVLPFPLARIAALFVLVIGAAALVLYLNRQPAAGLAQDATPSKAAAPASPAVPSAPPFKQLTDSVSPADQATKGPGRTNTLSPSAVIVPPASPATARARLPEATNGNKSGSFYYNQRADSAAGITLRSAEASSQADAAAKAPVMKQNGDTIFVEVVLTPLKDSQDIVITQMKARARAERRQEEGFKMLEPEEGWGVYNEYVSQRLKEVKNTREKPQHGDVVLGFEVNAYGEPVNIRVVEAGCEACIDRAIRMLKEGPKWKQQQKSGQIRIHF